MNKKDTKGKKPNTTNTNKNLKNSNTSTKKKTIKQPVKPQTVQTKRLQQPIKQTKPTNNIHNTKNIKGRITKRDTQQDNNVKVACLIALILIVVLFYFILDWFFALLTAVGTILIIGIANLVKKNRSKRTKKVLKILLIIFLVLAIIGVSGFSAFMLYIKKEADPIYNISKLETPENTTFLNIHGVEYAKLGKQMREKVTYDELPQVLIDALIATEDSRFYQHNGMDAPRFLKAVAGQLLGKDDAGGGSTITMQVVKNSFTDPYASSGIKGIIRKFKDIYLAIFKLEKDCTKEKIIEYYVNNHYLGGNIYGVQEAAESYFGKDVSELNLSEAAILAGMFKSPLYYRPTVYPDHAEERRATVLYLMKRHGYITAEEEKIANSIPVNTLTDTTKVKSSSQYQGYIDTVVAEIEDKYDINAYTTPLLVYTNLDPSKQDAVNSVLNGESYNWINDKVQAGVSVLDSATGKILAIGNGRNIDGRSATDMRILNFATDINRQPGSTAKPLFDYGPGIEYNNWSTYTLFNDAPYTYSNGRSIKNWDSRYFGTITMRRALAASRNIPALKAFQQVDNSKISEFVQNLGIAPEFCKYKYKYDIESGLCINLNNKSDKQEPTTNKIHEAHSIGSFEPGTNPLEMSAAYAAFSNGGTYHEPYSVSKIVFKATGEEKVHEDKSKKAMSDATAFMISSILQDVALTGGTPKNVACKTGTTNFDSSTMDNLNMPGDAIRDSWVVGYSTKTVVALWYGYETTTKNSVAEGYVLHNIPATIQKDRIFNALVSAGAMESNRSAFVQPSSVTKVGVVAGSNPPMLPGAYTGKVVYEYFKKGYEPDQVYEEEKLDKPKNLKANYNNSTKKVTLSWNAVSQGNTAGKGYGTFGYNIYYGSTLIDFTEKTTYTYTPKGSPYGTYKVIASYKGYSGIQSQPATVELKELSEEEQIKEKLNLSYTGTTVIPKDTPLTLDLSKFVVKYDDKQVNATMNSCTPLQISVAGKVFITCNITYNNNRYNLNTSFEVTKEQEITPTPNQNTPGTE